MPYGVLPPLSKVQQAKHSLEPARDHDSERRVIQIDGKPGKSQSALAEVLSVVWLTPQMDRLLVESARGRRKFLDRLVFGLDPAHAGRVTRHDGALRQRARLLAERPGETAWLDAVETELAATGVALAAARLDMVARLSGAIDAATGPFPRPVVAADGPVENRLAKEPALAVEDWLRESLARKPYKRHGQRRNQAGCASRRPCRHPSRKKTCRQACRRPASRRRSWLRSCSPPQGWRWRSKGARRFC